MFLEIVQNSSLIESLAAALLHSIWQIALVSFCLLAALRLIPKANAQLRYSLASGALLLSLFLPLITFVYTNQFPFYFSNQRVISQKTSENIRLEQIRLEEALAPDKKPGTSFNTFEIENSVVNWKTRLSGYFATYSPVLVAFWLIGILFFSFRLFGGFWQVRQLKTREVSEPEEFWQFRFQRLCEKLQIRQKVKLLQSNLVKSPMVVGWLKPVILIPTSIFLQMKPDQLETIIAHELMHIRRFDYLVNFVQNFVEILFFYHPCVWWISTEIRRERECACDDAVLTTLENVKITYASALANLEDLRKLNQQQTRPQMEMAANGGKLMNRIKRILEKEKTRRSRRFQNSLWSASLASMLILAFLVTVFWANGRTDVKGNINNNSERKLAVGFVAIPPGFKRSDKTFDETARLLISKLKENEVPAIGFVTGSKISQNNRMSKANSDILRMWRDAGLEIGVGGYEHIRFYDTGYQNFVENTKNNLEIVKPIVAEKNQEIRFFSYPYLNTGKDIETKKRFEKWLTENDLQYVPYTFDNQEWLYAYAYDVARKMKDSPMQQQIKRDFLKYMEKMVVHYENYSATIFGREIPQTLVLTTSRLVADTADELFGIFKERGYEFVPMDQALQDEAYQRPENFTGRAGISWLERWSITMGGKLLPEPQVANEVDNIWRNMNRLNDQDKSPVPPPPPVPAVTPTPPPKPPNPPKPPKPPKNPKPDKPPAKAPPPPPPPSAPRAPEPPRGNHRPKPMLPSAPRAPEPPPPPPAG
jgi:beta-lactamase regulating signal transducer with metallopeptidase domain/peptidoglycan/xylan/chitin deacetylase (PgdA/CDA1 family)